MSRRILFVDQSGQPGGAELCLADLARDFHSSAAVLLLSDGPFVRMLEDRGIETKVLPMPPSLAGSGKGGGSLARPLLDSLGYLPKLRKHFCGADLLYLNTAKALVLGMAANFGKRVPTVFHLHDFLVPEHFGKRNLKLLAALTKRVDLVIANSEATAEACRKAGGASEVTVIPNGFDVSQFQGVTAEQVRAHRDRWNPENKTVLAIFGRLSRWKGQDVLLRAVSGLPDCHVWVVGDALFTEDDRAYAQELRAMAAESPLSGRVSFAGHRDDIPIWMHSADLVVHASTAPEPFGRVIVEAMLCRRPVIASDAGGPREILFPSTENPGESNKYLGHLHEPGNPESLRSAIAKTLQNPESTLAMSERAFTSARNRFDIRTVIGQTRAALSKILPE